MPLALPEELYAVVLRAASPIVANERRQFLEELASELARHPVIGEGLVHRAAAALQRRFTVEARNTAAEEQGRRQATETKQARFGRSRARAVDGAPLIET
jgi:hypothetical protein